MLLGKVALSASRSLPAALLQDMSGRDLPGRVFDLALHHFPQPIARRP